MKYLFLAVLGICAQQSLAAAESAVFAGASMPLEAGFKAPPSQDRPQTWWHWMNGNVTRLIGDEQSPDDCEWAGKALAKWPDWLANSTPRPAANRIAFATWKHWTADDPLLPSGLLGPVTLHLSRLWSLQTTQSR